jgi:8-oxo-dGTP pyrophosphatase MutT (NUDIX family)
MTRRIGPWTVRKTRIAFRNPWIEVEDNDVLRPDGAPGQYSVVRFANLACGVLPVAADGTTWLVGQHRFPLDEYSWELPEGGGHRDIDPLVSTQRELLEETGLTAESWSEIGRWNLSNSVTDEVAIAYVAWGLTLGAARPEPEEELTLRQVAISTLVDMCLNGEVSDGFTALIVLTAMAKARQGHLPEPVASQIIGSGCRLNTENQE